MNIDEHDHRVAEETARRSSEELDLCQKAIANLALGFNLSRGKVTKRTIEFEVIQLTALGFGSLRWSLAQLQMGYYGLSISSSRLAWECWLNGVYLESYPDRLEDWNNFKTRPSPSKMRELVAAKAPNPQDAEEFEAALNDLYIGVKGRRLSGFSTFSHASADSIAILLKQEKDDGYTLQVSGEYDEPLFLLGTHLMLSASSVLASLFMMFIADNAEFTSNHATYKQAMKEWAARKLQHAS